jgi:hypothetical protein
MKRFFDLRRKSDCLDKVFCGEGNLLLVNNRPDVLTMEGAGDIAFFQPADDLNLMNDLTDLSAKMDVGEAEPFRTLPSLSGCLNIGSSFPIISSVGGNHHIRGFDDRIYLFTLRKAEVLCRFLSNNGDNLNASGKRNGNF